jgi:hypothetical protein
VRARWLVVAVVLAVVALLATLYLRVAVMYTAILFPLGDVPGLSATATEGTKVLYVNIFENALYATVSHMGRAELLTNTTGWHALTVSDGSLPPAAGLAVLPSASASFSLGAGSVTVYNYNGTHGAVVLERPDGSMAAWAAAIVPTAGGTYVWHPVVPDGALRSFIAGALGASPGGLYVPSPEYISFVEHAVCVDYDLWTGSAWLVKAMSRCYPLGSFAALEPNTPALFNGLELGRAALPDGTTAYAYWPTLACFSAQNVTEALVTYLRAAAR